jgi:hypothetical protein
VLLSPPRFWITLKTNLLYSKYSAIITNNLHVWNENLAPLGNAQYKYTVHNREFWMCFNKQPSNPESNSSLIFVLFYFSLSELVPVREIKNARTAEVPKESQGKLPEYMV